MKNQRVVPNKLTSEYKGYYMWIKKLSVLLDAALKGFCCKTKDNIWL